MNIDPNQSSVFIPEKPNKKRKKQEKQNKQQKTEVWNLEEI